MSLWSVLFRFSGCTAVLALLGACSVQPSRVDCPACVTCARCAGTAEPAQRIPPLQEATWADLPGWSEDDLQQAWPAFLRSCRAFRARKDGKDWLPACDAATKLEAAPTTDEARRFFETHFRPWSLVQPDGTREGLITGYYEPVLRGSRTRTAKAVYPVLGVPDDLLVIDLSEVYPELKSMRLRGRIQGRRVVPYETRAGIRPREQRAREVDDSGVLAWVEDPVELFFMQIQGSGRIALDEGGTLRLGYADQNGHPYRSVGRVLIERGELKLEEASMQGIQAWARSNPEKLDGFLDANPSYVFFRNLPDSPEGPPGALGQALVAERTVAIDPRYTPLGAPVFLATTYPLADRPLNRLVLAQDTGGAIKGVVRADFYWGTGPEAGQQAGRMKQPGRLWVFLPVGVSPPP